MEGAVSDCEMPQKNRLALLVTSICLVASSGFAVVFPDFRAPGGMSGLARVYFNQMAARSKELWRRTCQTLTIF